MNLFLRDMLILLIVRGVSFLACLNEDPRISRVLYVDIPSNYLFVDKSLHQLSGGWHLL